MIPDGDVVKIFDTLKGEEVWQVTTMLGTPCHQKPMTYNSANSLAVAFHGEVIINWQSILRRTK